MEKLRQKILGLKFGPLVKRLVILTLCVALLGTVFAGVLLHPQITQAAQAMEDYRQAFEWDFRGYDSFYDGHSGWGAILRQVPAPSLPAVITLAVFTGILLLLFVILRLLVPAWLYQAATRSRMNTLLWPVLGVAGSVWALIPFLIARSFLRQRCSVCGTWQKKALYCHACGKQLIAACPACGEHCDPDDRYCPQCGENLRERAASASADEIR